jgi:hypothetical protein
MTKSLKLLIYVPLPLYWPLEIQKWIMLSGFQVDSWRRALEKDHNYALGMEAADQGGGGRTIAGLG